jgi:hypothetical protein
MGVELLDNGYDIPPNEVEEMKNMAAPIDAKHEISEIEKSFLLSLAIQGLGAKFLWQKHQGDRGG